MLNDAFNDYAQQVFKGPIKPRQFNDLHITFMAGAKAYEHLLITTLQNRGAAAGYVLIEMLSAELDQFFEEFKTRNGI